MIYANIRIRNGLFLSSCSDYTGTIYLISDFSLFENRSSFTFKFKTAHVLTFSTLIV